MNKDNLCKFLLILSDFITIFVSIILSYSLFSSTHNIEDFIPFGQGDNFLTIHFVIALCACLWFWLRLRHYTYRKPFWFELKEMLRTLAIFFIIELAIIALSKLYVSRHFWVTTWIFVFLLMPICRILLKYLLIRIKLYTKNTIIIGSGKNAIDVFHALKQETYLGFNITLFVATDKTRCTEIDGVPIVNTEPQVLLHRVDHHFTQFIIALDEANEKAQNFWLRSLIKKGCRAVSVIPDFRGIPLYGTDIAFLFSHEIVLFRVNNNLAKRSSKLIKRLVDILGSIILMILLSPIFLVLYLLIKKDGGPAIYRHTRIGQYRKEFKCLKFRSMKTNSNELLSKIINVNPAAKAEWEKDFKLKHDPRITSIGKYLRKYSLDELPQLWNVLKGEMSLVGPRPIVKKELDYYQEDIDYYLMAKPGMTGLWQVSGRNNVDYETRVYFDTWYAKNWSLWNDIVILFKTVKVVLNRDGAY